MSLRLRKASRSSILSLPCPSPFMLVSSPLYAERRGEERRGEERRGEIMRS
jgi:hypothetical protein